MKKGNLIFVQIFLLALVGVFFFSCEDLVEDETPTKSKMEGVWKVSAVYNDKGNNIYDSLNLDFPITAFHLSSDNTVISTAAPLTMFVVYGQSKYVQIASTVDQVFNYASLDWTGGEFFIGGGVQERFTLELKLEGLPGQKTLTTLLDLIGIGNDYLDVVVYHKFRDVKVSFESDDVMVWEWDNVTNAVYNTKDQYGDYILWEGWPVSNFQKCTVKLQKQISDLKDLVENAK